jgi:hypothetical protein
MKKVFLSLAMIAALTVVSCKQAEATETTTVDTLAVDTTVVVADTVDVKADTVAVEAAK